MKTALLILLTCLCLCQFPAAAQKPAAPTPEAFWPKFQSAVAKGDKQAVAAMVKLPLTMPYGVKTIRTKAQFLQSYAKIFDAETKKCFAAARPEREDNKSKKFYIGCGEAMMYWFDLVGGEYKLVAVDNINE